MIGTSIGTTATSATINVAGNATTTAAGVILNVYGVNNVTHFSGGIATLIQGGGTNTLNNATYTLGTVYNNTDFIVGTITKTANTVTIATTAASTLPAAYWIGGLAGNTNVWAASNGTSASNWRDSSGTASAVVPGSTTDVVISSSNLGSPITPVLAATGTLLGTDMIIQSLTIADTATAFRLNADGYRLTISPIDSSTGITMNANIPASTISAIVALGASQTWTNNSGNSLTVSGAVSGGFSLTKAGAGTLVLSGSNNYSGGTAINAGTLVAGSAGALPATRAVTLGGGTLSTGTVGVSSNPLGTLTVNGTSGITLASNAHTLTFTTPIYMGGTLNVTGYAGFGGNSTSGQILFSGYGSNAATAISSNTAFLANVQFASYALGDATFIANGSNVELVPVPEPGTLLLFGTAGLAAVRTLRRRK